MSLELSEAVAAMIASRAEERTQQFETRQAFKKAERAEKKRRRDYGLAQRHARKLARNQATA